MYINENEVRFYFIGANLGDAIGNDVGNSFLGTYLEVKADLIIDKVILSPKMRGNSSDVLIQLFEERYPFLKKKIVKSNINID